MIYLNNNTEPQEVWIEKDDGLGSVHTVKSYEEGYADGIEHQKELLSSTTITINGEYERENGWSTITVNVPQTVISVLEDKEIVVSQDVTVVTPDAGYDGFSGITIDATEYGQSNYDSGFDDGFTDGYASGSTEGYESGVTDGEQSIIDTFTSTTITINGQYGSSASPYSSVTVNVAQTGHTDQELQDAYNSGYTSGSTDGYTSGYTSGSTDGYNSGVTDGEQSIIDTFTSTTVTINGVYGSTANPISSITVNVPQSGQSVTLEEMDVTISADTTNVVPDAGYDGLSKVNIDATDYGNSKYNSGYTSGYTSGSTDGYDSGYTSGYSSGYSSGYNSGYTSGSTDGYESGYTSGSTDGFNSGYTSGETHQKSLLGTTAFTINGSYSAENGYSAITVNVPIPNIEANKEFTATTNGDYTITPSTASTTVNAHLNTWNQYIISIDFNGYPSGYFNVLTIKSDDDNKYINVYYSGNMPYHNSIGWIGDPVSYEYKSSTQLTLHISNANENYRWEKNSGFLEPYDAMSAVSLNVNVPMPKIETNKEFTATTNGYYWVSPTSGSVSINDRFDSDDDCYYITATTSGYPLIGRYNIFYIEDEFDSSKGQIDVYIDNGYLEYDDSLWDGGEIMEDDTGDILRLKVYDANNGFGWMRDEDYNLKYDAMNGLGVVVEVPQTGSTIPLSSITITANTSITETEKAYSAITVNVPQTGSSLPLSAITITGNTAITVNDKAYTGITVNVPQTGHTDQELQDAYDSGFTSGETAGFNSGYTSGGADVISTFISTAVTENGVYGSSANPYSAITVNVDTASTYNSGYTSGYSSGFSSGYTSGYTSGSTDGYNSGYTSGHTSGVTDGQNEIIATFSSMTATTNGVYGSSAHPCSAITVNVPQSGVVIDLNKEYIERTITAITIPTSCTIVGRDAFSHCEQARTIEIPNTVTGVSTAAFSHCHSVTAITFGTNIEYIGPYAFEHCGYWLVPPQSINNGHIILPDSVKKVDYNAFENIDISVTAITFGSGTVKLYNDILMSTNIQEIYCYATTAPERQVNIISGTFDGEGPRYEYWTFRGVQNTGTVHYPAGSDYSSWQNDVYLSGWTFIADL